MKRIRFSILLLVAGLWVLPGVASAQPFPGPKGDCPNPQVQQRFREVRAKVLREHVGLDEATAAQAEQIMDEFMSRRWDLRAEVREHRQELRALIVADSDDQKAYAKALDGLTEAQDKLYKLRLEEMDALSEIMTPKEQAKLLDAMQEMRRRGGRGMHGRGPGRGYGAGPGRGYGPGAGGYGAGGYGAGGYGGGPGMGW